MNNAQKMIKYAAIIFAITLIVGIFSSIIMFLTGNIFGSKEGININKYDNNAKILLGVARGKKVYDKRETIKERDLRRESMQLRQK